MKHALRRLRRAPAFTAAVLLTLGLGIGANTSIVSAIYALLLKPLPYAEPDRLVELSLTGKDKRRVDPSLLTILDWREQAKSLETVAGGLTRSFGLTASGSAVTVVLAGMVTSDFPQALGMQPVLGRAFSEQEEKQNSPVAILTDSLWRRRFGADASVLARRIELNEESRTVIGVLPPGFDFPLTGSIPDLLIPINHSDYGRVRGAGHLQAIGRLRRGVTLQEAQAGLQGALGYPEYAGLSAAAGPLDEALRGRNRRPLLLLGGCGLLLLAIVCANVINLLLAQSLARSREIGIRVSLGASPGQLARDFLVDGMTLSALGAAAGLLFAALCQSGLPPVLRFAGVRAIGVIPLESPALLFALGAMIFIGLLFTLVPLGRAAGHRLRGALVVAQVALSMTLLLSAGLLLRSFSKVMSVDPGFRANQVYSFGIGIPEARYNSERKMVMFHRQVLSKLRDIPGVEAAAFSGRPPLMGSSGTDFQFEELPVEKRQRPRVAASVVSPDYLRVLSITLRRGRNFSGYDHADAPRVALVNEAFVRAYSPNADPLGRHIRTGWENGELNPGGAVSEIVGVVADVRQQSLEIAPQPQIYLCALQYGLEGGVYLVRGAGLGAAAQAAVASVDSRLQSIQVRPMTELVSNSLADRRMAALLLGLLALAALGLTAVGIYGVVAFLAGQRTAEMAIRLALGAQPMDVTLLIVGQGVRMAAIGVVLGGLMSLWAGDLLRARLFEIGAFDPLTVGAAAATMIAAAAIACAGPAWRVLTRSSAWRPTESRVS